MSDLSGLTWRYDLGHGGKAHDLHGTTEPKHIAASVYSGWKADVAPTRSFELAGAWKLSEFDAAWATS